MCNKFSKGGSLLAIVFGTIIFALGATDTSNLGAGAAIFYCLTILSISLVPSTIFFAVLYLVKKDINKIRIFGIGVGMFLRYVLIVNIVIVVAGLIARIAIPSPYAIEEVQPYVWVALSVGFAVVTYMCAVLLAKNKSDNQKQLYKES